MTGASSRSAASLGAASDALNATDAGPPPCIEYLGGVSCQAATCASGISTAPWHSRLVR